MDQAWGCELGCLYKLDLVTLSHQSNLLNSREISQNLWKHRSKSQSHSSDSEMHSSTVRKTLTIMLVVLVVFSALQVEQVEAGQKSDLIFMKGKFIKRDKKGVIVLEDKGHHCGCHRRRWMTRIRCHRGLPISVRLKLLKSKILVCDWISILGNLVGQAIRII